MKICLICELNSQVILMFVSDKIYNASLVVYPEFASRWNVKSGFRKKSFDSWTFQWSTYFVLYTLEEENMTNLNRFH